MKRNRVLAMITVIAMTSTMLLSSMSAMAITKTKTVRDTVTEKEIVVLDVEDMVAPTVENKEKVIFDTDMGLMGDDGRALTMLLQSDVVDVLGITTVLGNVWVEEALCNTLLNLEMLKRTDIPVYAGLNESLMGNRYHSKEGYIIKYGMYGHGCLSRQQPASYLELSADQAPPAWLGYPKTKPQEGNAVNFIVDTVKANPNEVTLIVIGACTNVAMAVKKNPEIVPLVKQVIYMGGAFDVPGNSTPAAEFNFLVDPEAAKMCLTTPFPRQIIVPLDVCRKAYITKTQFDRIATASETPITKIYAQKVGERFADDPTRTSSIYDEITAAILIDPTLITEKSVRYVDVDTNVGLNYGRSMGYLPAAEEFYGKPKNVPANSQPAEVIMGIDVERFWDLFCTLMSKPIA